MSRNPKFSSPYSAFEEKGCNSAFPKLASWADPHGQTSLHDRLCPAVSDVSSPTTVVPGMWEALRYFLNEQTSLNYAFVFIFNFPWWELVYRVDVSRSFFWVLHYLLCELIHDVVSLDEGWCLSIDSNTCFLPFILQITTCIQRVKELASNSIETTLGLPNACRNHKKFLDLVPLTLLLGPWELFVLVSGLGLNINRFFIVFNLTPLHSWKIRGNLVSCKSTTKAIRLSFTVWWVLPWVLLLIILIVSTTP